MAFRRSAEAPRLVITNIDPDQFHDLHQMAFQTRASVSLLARLAIARLLVDFDEGKIHIHPDFKPGREPGHA